MKQLFKVIIVLIIAISFLGVQGAIAKPKRLTMHDWQPPMDGLSIELDKWALEFEAMTNGRYKIEIIHGCGLATMPKSYDAAVSGIADIAHFIPQDTNKPFHITEISSLPFTTARVDARVKAWYESIVSPGYVDKEYSETKLLWLWPGTMDNLGTNIPVTSIADLKGIKIATGGGPCRPKMLKMLGAVPVFIPPVEVTPMLEKGTVEGVNFPLVSLYSIGWGKFIKYKINPMDMFYVCHGIAINKRVFDSFPDDIKEKVDAMAKDVMYPIRFAHMHDVAGDIHRWLGPDGTGKELDWSDDDKQKLEVLVAPLWEEWIEKKEKLGVPARKAVNAYYNALKAHGVKKPAIGYAP